MAAIGHSGSVSAQSTDASIAIDDQETDGQTIVVAEARTDVEATLIIISDHQVDGTNINYRTIELGAGTDVTDRPLELSKPIPETQEIRAEIWADDELLARDSALVAVDESIADAGPAVELVEADPDSGFYLPYALFKPTTDQTTERPIYVQPNNAPRVETRDELQDQITDSEFRAAGELRFPGLIPGLPRLPEDGLDLVQTLAIQTLRPETGLDDITTDAFPQETIERVDEQIVNMIDDARERLGDEGYPVSDLIHMEGFSGAGTFTSRFAFLHPGRVSTISVGGTGAAPLPHDTLNGTRLPYPLGTADYEDLTGRSFDEEAWMNIDQFFFNGEEDQPLPETDPRGYYGISTQYGDRAVDVYGKNRITERLPITMSVYEEAGASMTSKVYEGVGHLVNGEMLDDIVAFHRERSTAEHALFGLSVRRSADQIGVDESVTVTVDIENRVSRVATATPSLSVDQREISTKQKQISPGESETIEFEHSFDTPGSYEFRVDGRRVSGSPIEVVENPQSSAANSSDVSTAGTEPTKSPTPEQDDVTAEEQPGFGVLQAIASAGGLGYLIKRRASNNE
ncbi:hypothetical protein ACFQAS_14470 [Halopenitus salinus]|uniref:PGF-CTERM sorting domain-containing protein n=1 Tax=Halopenitus salinus TaxID=1198295 RepID=A0ABD5UUB9_9EURY